MHVHPGRLPYRCQVERPRQAQGPGKRPPLLGEVDAARHGMHGGAPSRQPAGRVGDQTVPGTDDTQQGGLDVPLPAAHAGAHRARDAGRSRVYRPPGGPRPGQAPAGYRTPSGVGASVSLWMSIRQPVSRAASRAFWPSLPMARDSW